MVTKILTNNKGCGIMCSLIKNNKMNIIPVEVGFTEFQTGSVYGNSNLCEVSNLYELNVRKHTFYTVSEDDTKPTWAGAFSLKVTNETFRELTERLHKTIVEKKPFSVYFVSGQTEHCIAGYCKFCDGALELFMPNDDGFLNFIGKQNPKE